MKEFTPWTHISLASWKAGQMPTSEYRIYHVEYDQTTNIYMIEKGGAAPTVFAWWLVDEVFEFEADPIDDCPHDVLDSKGVNIRMINLEDTQ